MPPSGQSCAAAAPLVAVVASGQFAQNSEAAITTAVIHGHYFVAEVDQRQFCADAFNAKRDFLLVEDRHYQRQLRRRCPIHGCGFWLGGAEMMPVILVAATLLLRHVRDFVRCQNPVNHIIRGFDLEFSGRCLPAGVTPVPSPGT
jgi:hypothetical protein